MAGVEDSMNAKHEHVTPPDTLEAYLKAEMAKGVGSDFVMRVILSDDGRVFVYLRPEQLRNTAPYCVTTPNLEVKGNLVVQP